jgi:hypothetical protein
MDEPWLRKAPSNCRAAAITAALWVRLPVGIIQYNTQHNPVVGSNAVLTRSPSARLLHMGEHMASQQHDARCSQFRSSIKRVLRLRRGPGAVLCDRHGPL